MRFGKGVWAGAGLLVGSAVLLHGELPLWVQHIPSGPTITALFKTVAMPGGAVPILRTPAESRPALTALIGVSPNDSALYRLRAQAGEMAQDFAAAEADWKGYAERASDRYAGRMELADFYHRRARSNDELTALLAAAQTQDDPLLPASTQRAWLAFERMATLDSAGEPAFRAWVARYPQEPAAHRKLIEYLTNHKQFGAAETEIAAYGSTFHDEFEPVRMRADLEMRRGSADAALAVFDRAFQPLWPDDLRASYFKLLEEQGQLREFAGRARTVLAANPTDLDATARLFHYFRAQNNPAAARRVLLEYRIAKESGRPAWSAGELETMAELCEWLPDVNEAARFYYALYGSQPERALYGLANLLLTQPEQPIQFGSGDLSFYKDIATVDTSPGFLNGILSLLLNWSGARSEYQDQNQKSTAYFHRAAAAQLVTLLDQRFPQSAHRDGLHAALVAAYGAYGDDASVIRAGREYLAGFPSGGSRVGVTMQIADALARANRTTEEFALYDQMLRELGTEAAGVPVGSTNVRSAEYVQVLDKYLARLAALKRPQDAIRVYRTEIDRNPNDPGLYLRLSAMLEQGGVSRDVEAIYTQAIAKFPDRSWYHKLARWYLRKQEFSALEKITRDAIAAFSGSELEVYFKEIVAVHPDASMYRQLNLYAHERFPEDLLFVHNLLSAYSRVETRDASAYDRLLRNYWFYDPQLRTSFFYGLSVGGRLTQELAEIRAANPAIGGGRYDQAVAANPAAVQFVVEAEAWLSHFEAAAPAARALATAYPGRREFASKASTLYRSLAAFDPRDTEVAVTLAGYEQKSDPRDAAILARMGDIYADRELFTRARTFWERMPATQPAKPDAYLDAATVYWDYYRFDDALRLIAEARKKFDKPALYAYQAGAIYENKRDFAGAVREYLAGAIDGQNNADERLIRLLQRPETRGIIDRATEAAVVQKPVPAAIALRMSVLEAMQRRNDLESLLQARVEAEKSAAELTTLQENARRLGFDRIQERAAERLAAVTNDPVDKMRLTLANVRLLESKKDLAGAARVVDALYRDHPLILGVVRGAVDFHVRNRQPAEAMTVLLDASKRARADLAAQFTLEAARVATDAGQIERARGLLTGLLTADPLRAEYLAAMADTYLQAHDDAGFRDYQLATIQRLKQSPLAAIQRVERIATVRRSVIPALDRLKDYGGAVDQYVEVVNSYPEDEALTKEAAGYAVAHGQTARLIAFYRKTTNDAPLDYRWPIVLGRIETVAEDYPAAIADYERGMKARPDRTDVLEAKARLEERLMRFGDAIQSYGHLYELAYRDPQWMIKVAELKARSGQSTEVVAALKSAVIGARTETADADFQIAERLEAWHILADAAAFAERGAALAGEELSENGQNTQIYARILTRARKVDAVLPHLGGNASVDQQAWMAMGRAIADTYTPEEKLKLEQTLTAEAARVGAKARNETLLPLATYAGMVDLEARWRLDAMLTAAPNDSRVDQQMVALQSQRAMYGGLGRELEYYAGRHAGQAVEAGALAQATQAFIAEGDRESELRVMRKALARNSLSGPLLDRYLAYTAAHDPDALLAVARGNGTSEVRDRAVQFALASEKRELAYTAVQTRGTSLPEVWTKAFTALAGRYFDDHSAAIDAAFQAALDTRTIGERLQRPLKPDAVVVGRVWFYYGARYGDHLLAAKNGEAGAWLAASLEGDAGDPESYMALGDTYAEAGDGAKAMAQYEHAVELDADRGDAYDHMARVLWKDGRQAEAVARWKTALAVFLNIQSRGVRVPEPYWHRLGAMFIAIGERHAMEQLHAEIANLLGDYYQRNREYRLNELIRPAVQASLVSGGDTNWLVEFGRSMGNPEMMLRTLMQSQGLTDAQRISLQREVVAVRTKQVESMFGDNRQYAQTLIAQARWELAEMLLNAGDVQGASTEWGLVPEEQAARLDQTVALRLASRAGTLGSVLQRYQAEANEAPAAETLQFAAAALRRDGDENGARSILEFVYGRELSAGRLLPANFLGLAEVKLQRSDAAAALVLLHRMALVADDGFDTLLPAAELLGKYGKTVESLEFVRRRLTAVPWDAAARLQLARDLPAGAAAREQTLAVVIGDSQAAYKVRADAARIATQPIAAVAGTELAVLSARPVTPEAAEKPFQVEARLDAAGATTTSAIRLRLAREALAIAPQDERVRVAALRASIASGSDSLSLAIEQGKPQPQFEYGKPMPSPLLSDAERATIAEALSAAAQRVDELAAAQNHLREAIGLRPQSERAPLVRRLAELTAEQNRRTTNASRQPHVRDVIEQDRVVRPLIVRSAQ